MQQRLLRAALGGAVGLTRALGPLRYPLADAGGMVAYAADAGRRRGAVRSHRRCAPEIDATEARRRARASFREYGRTVLDFLWACGLDDAEVVANTVVIGREHVEARRGRGGILAIAHQGNWDMAASIACANDIPLSTVMAPIGSAAITELVIWARQRNQLEVFTPERAARGLVRALRRGRFVALLCDIPGAGPETVVDYGGGPVTFSAVPAWLALRTGAALLPVQCLRGGPGQARYVATIHAPVAVAGLTEAEVMQAVADVLAPGLRAAPEQWYPFGDVYAD